MKKSSKLSIIVPCYNEKATIEKILTEINRCNIGKTKKEIIIVDDGSTDGTRALLKSYRFSTKRLS